MLRRLPGRLRLLRHLLLGPLLVLGGWAWFGVTGAVPVLVWWWHRRPRTTEQPWGVDLHRVRAARLGPWRTLIAVRGGRDLEIFNDEMAAADLARLRRTLKAQLAGH